MFEHPLGIPLRPWCARAGLRVLLVERDEQPHQLASHGSSSENQGKLRQVTQPLRVPRSPIWIVAIDNSIHAMMCLAGLVKQLCDSVDPVIHSAQSDDFRARLRDFTCPVAIGLRDGRPGCTRARTPMGICGGRPGFRVTPGSRRYVRDARGTRGAGPWSPVTLCRVRGEGVPCLVGIDACAGDARRERRRVYASIPPTLGTQNAMAW